MATAASSSSCHVLSLLTLEASHLLPNCKLSLPTLLNLFKHLPRYLLQEPPYACLLFCSSSSSLMKNLFANWCLAQEEAKSTAVMKQRKPRAFFGALLAWLRRKPKKTRSKEEAQEEGSIRLKLVLTKKEAAQLLALYVEGCCRGDTVETKLVGFRLENAAKIRSSFGVWRPMLESIPEH